MAQTGPCGTIQYQQKEFEEIQDVNTTILHYSLSLLRDNPRRRTRRGKNSIDPDFWI